MRVVQALHGLQDMLPKATERRRVVDHLRKILADPTHGPAIRNDLRTGLSALPIWMQDLVREVIADQQPGRTATRANK